MKIYRGEIINEKGQVIFSRRGRFENEQKCIDALKQRVCVDIPDQHSLIYNILNGGGFKDSPYYLGKCYNDITKLTFRAIE